MSFYTKLVLNFVFPLPPSAGVGHGYTHIMYIYKSTCLIIKMTRIIGFQIITPPISEKVSTFNVTLALMVVFFWESITTECTKLFIIAGRGTNALHFSKGSDVNVVSEREKATRKKTWNSFRQNKKSQVIIHKFWCLWLYYYVYTEMRLLKYCSTKFICTLFHFILWQLLELG